MTASAQPTILKSLNEQDEGFVFSQQISNLTELSPEETRKHLLQNSSKIQNLKLKNLFLHFHHKLAQDKNSYNAITEVLFRRSISKVIELSEKVNDKNIEEYPLFGYVFSIKDNIRMKGTKSTCGLAINQKLEKSQTPFPDYIESLGGTFLCKSNVPMLLFALESTNNLFGATAHPDDKTRSAGGSSGGEACLIAKKFVNAGIGSDIGGSLRIPALFCGIYSFMITPIRMGPTLNAQPFENSDIFSKVGDPQFMIKSAHGPMTRNIEELEKLTEIMVGFYKKVITIPPVPWRKNLKPIKTVAVLKEFDNLFEITQTNRRAMKEVVDVLTKQNIKIVEIDFREHIYQVIVHTYAIFLKNRIFMNAIEGKVAIGEPLISAFDNFVKLAKLPKFVLPILAFFMKDIKKKCFIEGTLLCDTYNQDYLMGQVNKQREIFMNQMKQKGADVILCHGMLPAIRHNTADKVNFWAIYTLMWNAFNFCGGSIPVTKVKADEQIYESRFVGPFEDMVRETMRGSEGLPVGIQVMAPPYMDEEAMQVMKMIVSGLKVEK